VRASLSAFCTWLAKEGYTDSNPVSFTHKAIERGARAHVPADHELAAIWRALGSDQYGTIVRLLMLTAARRDEIASLTWDEIDLKAGTITIAAERMKNRREHVIPISKPVADILRAIKPTLDRDGTPRAHVFGRRDNGYSAWSRPKAELDARIANAGDVVEAWTLHDFRRAASTFWHEQGVPPHVVEVLLSHVGGHKGGIAGVYNRAAYAPERTRATKLWAEHILSIVLGTRRKTPLRRRAK
jgi:integrase